MSFVDTAVSALVGTPVDPTKRPSASGLVDAFREVEEAIGEALADTRPPKAPVRVLLTTDTVIATALENGDTADGIVLATSDRVALTGQTLPAQNGVYVVQASGAAVRATDVDTESEIIGASFTVSEGAHANEVWTCTTVGTIVVGTTALTFIKTADANAAVAAIQADVDAIDTKVDGFGDAVSTGVSGVSAVQSIGTVLTPVSATALGGNVTYALAPSVLGSGFIVRLAGYAVNANTLHLRRFTKAGNDFTQVGDDYLVTLPAGAFDLDFTALGPIPIVAGEYIGFYQPNSSPMIGRTLGVHLPIGAGIYLAAGDLTTFTDAAIDITARVELTIEVGLPREGGEIANGTAVLRGPMRDAVDDVSEHHIVGTTETPVSASTLSTLQTYVLGPPTTTAGYLGRISGYAVNTGLLLIRRFTKSGNDFTQVGSDLQLVLSATGAFSVDMTDFGLVSVGVGEYMGFYQPSTPIIGRTLVTYPDGLWIGSGNVSSFTDATTDTAARVELQWDIISPAGVVDRIADAEDKLLIFKQALTDVLDEIGAYTPSAAFLDYDGAWYDFSDRRKMYTDTAGTTLVASNNDLIGYIRDKSPGGHDFAASTNARRPTYKTNIQNGRAVARFAGSHALEGLTLGITDGAEKITVFAAAKYDSETTNEPLLEYDAFNARVYVGNSPLVVQPIAGARRLSSDGLTLAMVATQPGTTFHIHEGVFDFSGGETSLYFDGRSGPDAVVPLPLSAPLPSGESAAWIGGLLAGSGSFLSGDIGEIIVVLGDIDDDTRESIYGYLGERWDVDYVDPAPYDFTGSLQGTWTWFNDPRVLKVGAGDLYVAGCVTSAGSIMFGVYDYDTDDTTAIMISRRFQRDDHENPAFLRRADGKLLAFWCLHGSNSTYWMAVSTNVDDPTEWEEPVNIFEEIRSSGGPQNFAYCNPVMLPDESDRIYLWLRNIDGVYLTDPWSWFLTWSDDGGATWTPAVRLLGDDRPYHKIRKTSDSRVDIIVNTGHPDEVANCSTFHYYYEAGSFYKTDGTLIGGMGDLPFDQTTDLTTVWDAAAQGRESWVWDVVADPLTDRPEATFATFSSPTPTTHDYRQARWTGAAWVVKKVADAGGTIYLTNLTAPTYSGGAVTDPEDINVVYCSREVDGGGTISTSGVHQLFKAVTANGGDTWTLTQLTFGTQACFRPFIPEGGRRLFYSTGRYDIYTDYDCTIESIDIS
jgi:hypothetical protein